MIGSGVVISLIEKLEISNGSCDFT